MATATPRAPVAAPTFVRLLTRLADADLPRAPEALAGRLGQWIDWSRAVALSTALDGRLPRPARHVPDFDADEDAACARARRLLADAIAADPALAVPASPDTRAPTEFAPLRACYLVHQRAMQGTTGRLRGRLRDMLTKASPALARLAEVDAVMEQAISPREHALLAGIPDLLGVRFDRLQAAAHPAPRRPRTRRGADPAPPREDGPRSPASAAWLDTFRLDMRSVLLAELDVRFSPIDALLAALRTR